MSLLQFFCFSHRKPNNNSPSYKNRPGFTGAVNLFTCDNLRAFKFHMQRKHLPIPLGNGIQLFR